jgi:hypothetical protein
MDTNVSENMLSPPSGCNSIVQIEMTEIAHLFTDSAPITDYQVLDIRREADHV